MSFGDQAGAGHGSTLGPPLPTAYKREAARENRSRDSVGGSELCGRAEVVWRRRRVGVNNKMLSAEACRATSPRVLSCHPISDHCRPTRHSRPAPRPRAMAPAAAAVRLALVVPWTCHQVTTLVKLQRRWGGRDDAKHGGSGSGGGGWRAARAHPQQCRGATDCSEAVPADGASRRRHTV